VASDFFKDILSRLRNGEGARWETPADVSATYKEQLDSEKKVASTKCGGRLRWKPFKRDNHLWDAENYCTFAAVYAGVFTADRVEVDKPADTDQMEEVKG
jgi:hypothetical protein